MTNSPLDLMVHKLSTRTVLSDADRDAILSLPYALHTYHAASYIIREGDAPRSSCYIIQDGYAYRHKLTAQGARQIVSIHLRGDFIDLQQLFLNTADHNVQALTQLKVLGIEREALQTIAFERPAVGRAMWIDDLVDSSIYREWVMNVGRRDARTRISHVLCELALRMKAAGVASDEGYEMPLTQEQLADVTGLTPVHVSRTLTSLEKEGIVKRARRFVTFKDWATVAATGDFNPRYLHLEQPTPERVKPLAN